MPAYTWYATPVNSAGTATGPSTPVSVWVGPLPHPAPPPSYDLYVNDANNNGTIEASEWQATTGGGQGLNGASPDRLFDGNPGGSGTIYSATPYPTGTTGLKDGLVNNFAQIPGSLTPPPPCFVRGTRIKVPGGWTRVEDLAVGDAVCLFDGGTAPIRWVARAHVSAARLAADPRLRPIRIRRGHLGPDQPQRDLLVSAQHRMLLRSWMAHLVAGESEVLVPAIKLLGLRGVSVDMRAGPVDYYHFALPQHDVVIAEGLPAESLYLGKGALQGLGLQAERELRALFPDFARQDRRQRPARVLLDGPSAAVVARSLAHLDQPWV